MIMLMHKEPLAFLTHTSNPSGNASSMSGDAEHISSCSVITMISDGTPVLAFAKASFASKHGRSSTVVVR